MPHQNGVPTRSYKNLSTQVLEEMIYDIVLSETEMDMEQVNAILRELNNRGDTPSPMLPEKAWNIFWKEYADKESAYLD